MVTSPVDYARAAVATIGIQNDTYGCFSHALLVSTREEIRHGDLNYTYVGALSLMFLLEILLRPQYQASLWVGCCSASYYLAVVAM